MMELTEVECIAVRSWKGTGGYTSDEIASKILANRHYSELHRIYMGVCGE